MWVAQEVTLVSLIKAGPDGLRRVEHLQENV
jgi:hypothetical protein